MKTVLIDFPKSFGAGDFVQVLHTSPGGGRNVAKYWVGYMASGQEAALYIASLINGGNSEWNAGSFQAAAEGLTLTIMCNDKAGDVDIYAQVDRADGTIEVFPVVVL